MATVAESISRIRGVLKAVKEDAALTDRFVYSLIMKYGKMVIYRDKRAANIFKNSGLFREAPCIELIEVSAIDACCIGIKTQCTYRRSKNKLPKMVELDNGPVIRAITTLDYSQVLNRSEAILYVNATKATGFKYNNIRYYWITNGYLFIPNVDWEAVKLQALFEEDVSYLQCDATSTECIVEQERVITIPEHLFAEIENYIRQEMGFTLQVPSDGADDQMNQLR